MLIHESDVAPAEISPVQDEANMLISISFNLVQHIFQLHCIGKAPRIFLVKQGLLIISVICNGIIEDRDPHVYFRVPEFDNVHISRLAVLIGCIVGDVNLFSS